MGLPAGETDRAQDMKGAIPDEELLSQSVRGSESMARELVNRYEGLLYGFICRFTGSSSEAADLCQETFMQAFKRGESFGARSSFKTWLYAIAVNACRGRVRARKARLREVTLDEEALAIAANTTDPDRTVEHREIGRHVARAVAGLPEEQREVFILSTYEKLSYPEIADALGRPLGTVKSQMRLALPKMRAALHSIAEEHGIS